MEAPQASLTLPPPAAIKRADEKRGGLAIWSLRPAPLEGRDDPVHQARPGGWGLGSLLGMTCEKKTHCTLPTLPSPLLPTGRKPR